MSGRAGRSISLALVLALPAFALAEEAPGCGTSYTVQQGDTVAAIAQRCGSTIDALIDANPDLEDPARISIGQELALPAAAEEAALEEGAEDSGESATPDGGTEASATESGEAEPSKAAPAGDADVNSGDSRAVESELETAPAEEGTPVDVSPEEGAEVSEEGEIAEDSSSAAEMEPMDEAGEENPAATSQPSDAAPAGGAEDEAGEEAPQDDAAELIEADPDSASADPEPQLYTVQPGDSMARIASRLGLKLDDLMAANEGVKPRTLQPGQELVLPAAPTVPDAPATRGLSALIDPTGAPDGPGNAVEATEPVVPPLVLEGRIRRGVECPMLHTRDGETYSLVSQDYGFTPGDYVSIEGEAVEMSFCNKGKTVRVTSMRVESETQPR